MPFNTAQLKNSLQQTLATQVFAGKNDAAAAALADAMASAIQAYVSQIKVAPGIPVATSGGSGSTAGIGNLE